MLIIINISHELGELEVFVALIHDIRELSMQFVLTVDETLKHLKSNWKTLSFLAHCKWTYIE